MTDMKSCKMSQVEAEIYMFSVHRNEVNSIFASLTQTKN